MTSKAGWENDLSITPMHSTNSPYYQLGHYHGDQPTINHRLQICKLLWDCSYQFHQILSLSNSSNLATPSHHSILIETPWVPKLSIASYSQFDPLRHYCRDTRISNCLQIWKVLRRPNPYFSPKFQASTIWHVKAVPHSILISQRDPVSSWNTGKENTAGMIMSFVSTV
jgi:hypothetical protein